MTNPAAKMLVHVGDRSACIRIIGRANFNFSLDFKTLVTELLQKGFADFVIDLSECLYMDSTFLGVLAGFGLKTNGASQPPGAHAVGLLNPNARITELLENLGVLDLFKILTGAASAANGNPPAATAEHSREDLTRTCLEAHQTLIAISPENAIRFKEVTRFLAEDLKKLEQR